MTTTRFPARRLAAGLAAALSIAFAGPALAANFSKAVYNGAKEDIRNGYKAQREQCNSLAGNAKDVCVEQAKGAESIAMAQLEVNYTGDPKDEVKLYEANYEAIYKVSVEKCDDLGGQTKDVCVREAKTERDKAKADVKLAKKVHDAVQADVSTKMKADYKLARERCDSLSGDDKNVCVASAKARFQER